MIKSDLESYKEDLKRLNAEIEDGYISLEVFRTGKQEIKRLSGELNELTCQFLDGCKKFEDEIENNDTLRGEERTIEIQKLADYTKEDVSGYRLRKESFEALKLAFPEKLNPYGALVSKLYSRALIVHKIEVLKLNEYEK